MQIHSGTAIGAVKFFAQAWNWAFSWLWNVAEGNGIKIVGRESDHPVIRANIAAGDGLKMTNVDGKLIFSLASSDKDKSGGKSGSGGSGGSGRRWSGGKSGSGGSGGSGRRGSGGGSGGAGGSGSGSSHGGGGGSGSGGSGGDGSRCNTWSKDDDNPFTDWGIGNEADNCDELNGW